MDVAFLLFEGVTPLDAVGPYEILRLVPGATVKFVAKTPGEQYAEGRGLGLIAENSYDDVSSADVLVIPGGIGTRELILDKETLEWIQAVDRTSRWTTSVCTGSLLLAAAGLLDGRPATTHWLEFDRLRELGADPVDQRVVRDGKYLTGAGVSAGIDMAITLVSLMCDDSVAMALQLAIEYDPQPPFDAGSPRTAPPELVEVVRAAATQVDS
ncbi:MAG: DJ-1/PfpI family protein [Solirubrobacterales bacterium]